MNSRTITSAVALAAIGLAAFTASASGQQLGFAPFGQQPTVFDSAIRQAPYEAIEEETGDVEIPAHLRRQVVAYNTREPAGTVVVDTANTYLYYVLGNGRAVRYGIGVGREGFTWSGTQTVTRKSEWPDWTPPAEMIERQPYLPRFMAGGPGNPMGARAMYLGNSIYRIHGTNQPSSIGQKVSSGCIRLLNEDVADLYSRVGIGSRVVVLPDTGRSAPVAVSNTQGRGTAMDVSSASVRYRVN
jgi:lipoprotein-anchoring transpeptidase ErfK/SrfK